MCKIALCLFFVLNYSIGKGQEARHYSQKYNPTRTSTKTFDWFLFVCRFTSAWQYFPTVKKYNSTRTSGKHSINFCFVCLSVGLRPLENISPQSKIQLNADVCESIRLIFFNLFVWLPLENISLTTTDDRRTAFRVLLGTNSFWGIRDNYRAIT